MKARMKNPALSVPNALEPLLALGAVAKRSLPARLLNLVYLRASQINGCGYCLDMHAREARTSGETEQRLTTVAAFRDVPFFDDAERAALALTEAGTRIGERGEAVPDALWEEAKRHFDEQKLAELTLNIALINFWNRVNVLTKQVAGTPVRD